MKCPKCGYTSFDDLQDCKKCGIDLSAFRSKFSLRSFLHPIAAAPETTTEQMMPAAENASLGGDATDFGYDFMEETATEPASSLDDLLGSESPAHTTGEEDDFVSQFLQNSSAKESSAKPSPSEDRLDAASLDPDVDFNWDDSEEIPEQQGKESGRRDFDLPSLEELPSLDDLVDPFGEDDAELSDFPDSDDLEEDLPKTKRKPLDPFDARGPAEAERSPAFCMSDAHEEPLSALSSRPDLDAGFERRSASVLPAPISLRLRAGIIDTAILVLAFALFLSAGEMILKGEFFPSAASLSELIIPYFLVFFFLCFGYFTLFHSLTGQTIGKMLLGLRVEAVGGGSLLFSQAFLRAAGGVLCLVPFGLGFLLILRAPEGRGVNDRLGGTWVICVQGKEDEEIEGEEYAL